MEFLFFIGYTIRYGEEPPIDFWIIFGKYHIYFAIIPFALALLWIAIDSIIRSRDEKRLILISYLSWLMLLAFILYIFIIYYGNKGSYSTYHGPTVSINYPILIFFREFIIAISVIASILIIWSFYAEDATVRNISKYFNYAFPYIGLVIISLSSYLNMKSMSSTHSPRTEGIFTSMKNLTNGFFSLESFIFPLALFFVGFIRYLYKNHRKALGISSTMIITSVIVFLAFCVEMYVHRRDGMFIFGRVLGGYFPYYINITIMHFVFSIIVISWLCLSRFRNQSFDEFTKKAAMGAAIGILAALMLLPMYIKWLFVIT